MEISETTTDALRRWAGSRALRGRSLEDSLRKAMKWLVSFAMAKVPKGDQAKVRQQLTATVRDYRRLRSGAKGKRAEALRGTLAAKLVFLLNYKGARGLAHQRSPQFYAVTQQFISARAFSANLHRAGFLPALRTLSISAGGGHLPKYRNMPGTIDHGFTDTAAEILVENFASSHGGIGITGLAGDAFQRAMSELETMLTGFLEADMQRAARDAGFRVTS